ncbi:MAG: hypothetical protein WCJ75_13440 [Desulfomonile sp.]
MKEDKKLDEAKLGHEKPQYEKPVVIDLGELPEVKGAPGCTTGSSVGQPV